MSEDEKNIFIIQPHLGAVSMLFCSWATLSIREKLFSLVEWSYNTIVHLVNGQSPFHIIFGKPPLSIPYYFLGTSLVEVVNQLYLCQEMLIML